MLRKKIYLIILALLLVSLVFVGYFLFVNLFPNIFTYHHNKIEKVIEACAEGVNQKPCPLIIYKQKCEKGYSFICGCGYKPQGFINKDYNFIKENNCLKENVFLGIPPISVIFKGGYICYGNGRCII